VELFAQSERPDQFVVAVGVFFAQVSEQSSSLDDHTENAALGVKIVFVGAGVHCQLSYPFGKQSYLNLGGPGVTLFLFEFANDLLFSGFVQIMLLC
jgi:hypothetical protein